MSSVQVLRGGAELAVRASSSSSPVSVVAFQWSLLACTFFCTACFGMMLFAALVLMPGLAKLADGEYLRAFQVIDAIIQNDQPLFLLFWVGAIVSLLLTCGLGIHVLEEMKPKILLVLFTLAYLAGQLTTVRINIPLNNRVQELNISSLDGAQKAAERLKFEDPWNKANVFRTVVFGAASAFLSVLLLLVKT